MKHLFRRLHIGSGFNDHHHHHHHHHRRHPSPPPTVPPPAQSSADSSSSSSSSGGLVATRAVDSVEVLADRIDLPCMLVKGSYYTGTDEGAVNLIKFDNGSADYAETINNFCPMLEEGTGAVAVSPDLGGLVKVAVQIQ
ncbi:hypothetical protein LOK49_LG13G02249 [Camellia lanceoleosa]|uniref:Uncharacterized protein n=1 Tax=Camellia lanceoleosa TaxID=1840588 RepID=A0ACC0FHD8_9ERIC|nr:hypothetical protein LOK49_LG13G02249 [Camellia lanceoleosa]